MNEDGQITVQPVERELAYSCQAQKSRQLSIVAVILAMILALVAVSALGIFSVARAMERRSFEKQTDQQQRNIDQLQATIATQNESLQCRAELNATLQQSIAASNQAINEMQIEAFTEFGDILNQRRPDPTPLRDKVAEAKASVRVAQEQADIYARSVALCPRVNIANEGGD